MKLIATLLVMALASAQAQSPVKDTGDTKPVPDPTFLTTQQLISQINSLKELMETQIDSLKVYHDERFKSVEQQFKERDTRTEQLTSASNVAISAALQAAKEAVTNQNISNEKAIAKSEANTTKLLDNLDTKIIDLKDSISALKNQGIGQTAANQEQQTDASFYVAALAVVVAIIGAGVAILRPKT